jgi:hypothetical protein
MLGPILGQVRSILIVLGLFSIFGVRGVWELGYGVTCPSPGDGGNG